RGIMHSEYNASESEPVHLLQIWIMPERAGLDPGYEQRAFAPEGKRGPFRLVASPDGRDGSVTIHQDAALYMGTLEAGQAFGEPLEGRHAWVQVVSGAVTVNGHELRAGDGAAVSEESALEINALETAELLLFDLA
ncbi:MAG TPA: pirin family protein, partial [Armatimonadota bacterium]|nr:pirin family protein [Armatimonadota bacterium]